MELIVIWEEFELLILNLQFYVAFGTISMAVATAWSIKRQGDINKIKDIRIRIQSFYVPFFDTFTYKCENEKELQGKWNNVRPFIRNASRETQNAFFYYKLNEKIPRIIYLDTNQSNERDYNAWDKFYAIAWNDFRDLDSKLMKLQKTKGTNLPESPGEHNFALLPIT